ncbi:MAG: alpha/beta fold hydrolase [Betaproteobacteria bacterium]|nr:alpha/beta fold hydrolase [Betaproteobacteria bacterium]
MKDALDYPINPAAYQWTGRFMRFLRRVLRVNIKLHHDEGQIESGDIFVFNHFARFETFIPQYLFWEHCGAYCRSIADHALFRPGDRFGSYLKGVGAVPNDHPHLLALLAAEILRGRKVIVFPEGGMVKDRQVLDGSGQYSIYSRSAAHRRKQHSGAAVIALALEVFKQAVLNAASAGDENRLESWRRILGLPDRATLLARAERPTLIVPANITFYPMRVRGNPLLHGVELFNRGISPRLREELLIEGNILLKDTDMDIRLGNPVRAANFWNERERRLVNERAVRLGGLQDAFTTHADRADRRIQANASHLQAERVRDAYMHAMYQLVTVNLSHLAALGIYELLNAGRTEVPEQEFHRILYLAVKYLQSQGAVHLHRSLRNPESYEDLPRGRCEGLEQFLRTTTHLKLIERSEGYYRFLPKLLEDHEFDLVRLENPVEVYANEVAPIQPALTAVVDAIRDAGHVSPTRLAELRFDDERRAHAWDRKAFDKPRHRGLNMLQTQNEDPEPFLFRPAQARSVGVLLAHGFLASPAEMRAFGETLSQRGFTTLGVRLKGHGTSPWDLRERTWQDWLASVRRGYEILSPLVDHVCLVGFSTGGSLCLHLASDRPEKLAGVAALAAPMRFRNRNMVFVPLVHGTNRLVKVVREHGLLAFRPNPSEHPHLNYVHMPIKALYELGRLVESVRKRLSQVACPALILQGDQDPVVDPESATLIYRAIGSPDKWLRILPSRHHGILYDNAGDTWNETLGFVERCTRLAGTLPQVLPAPQALPEGG